MKNNEKGFSGASVIIILIIVAVIATVGLIIWNRQPSKKNNANIIKAELQDSKTTSTEKTAIEDKPIEPAQPTKTTSTQTVNGVSFELPIVIGNMLTWNLTAENVNISSDTLLAKEKEVYGDETLFCKANDYALGRISVRDESTPYTGFELVKKLASGKYLYYQDDSQTSSCYMFRDSLHSLINSQADAIKLALKDAK